MPQAAGKAPEPAAQPSFVSRIVAPIVSAFGGGEKRPAAASPVPQPSDARAAESSVQSGGGRGGDRSERAAAETSTDPESDTVLPRLLGVEFRPATVQDGETTVLTVTAADDLSGVKTIAGNIASPSGALQGFSLDKEAENRFTGRLTVPKNAAEGVWNVNFLSLTDGASNTAVLSWRQNTIPRNATFLVSSSKPDTAAPSVRNIWLEKPGVRSGERVNLFVEMDDDQSGIHLVTGVFLSPSKYARIPIGCRQQAPQSPVWQCDVAPPQRGDCGDWQLEQVQVQDKANNQAVLRSDNPLVGRIRLNVTGEACDSAPPVAQSVAVEIATVAAPGVVRITVAATDDATGITSVNGHFAYAGAMPAGSQPPRLYYSCRASGDGQTWVGVVTIPEKAARGLWKLGSVQLVDGAGNLKIYVEPEPLLSGVAFRVE